MKLVFLAWLTGLLPFLAMAQPVARIIKQPKGCEVVFVSNISELSGDVSILPMCEMTDTDTLLVRFGPFQVDGTVTVMVYQNFKFSYYDNRKLPTLFDIYFFGNTKNAVLYTISFTVIPSKA